MSVLASYNPLATINLPGDISLEPRGLIVLVGPNSSGKTHFLNDIATYIAGDTTRSLVVCKSITAQVPQDPQAFMEELFQRRYLVALENGICQLNVPNLPFEQNRQQQRQPFTRQQFEHAVKSFGNTEQASHTHGRGKRGVIAGFGGISQNENQYLHYLGPTLVTFLPTEERINATKSIAKRNNGPQHIPHAQLHALIHALHENHTAQETLSNETIRAFGNAVFLDQSTTELILRVTGRPEPPRLWDANDAVKVKSFREISDEGDGYRSYVGTCMALLVGDRPVTLIDEPELYLHPPQAHELGRFIGENATRRNNHATFVATHDSHLLRGILETATAPQVLRLNNKNSQFFAHFVRHDDLTPLFVHPKTWAEPILDGVFSDAVCLVEADSDRHVYQAALEGVVDPYKVARLHFVPLGGVGEFVPPCRLYHGLKMPLAIITDADFMLDEGRVGQVLPFLTSDTAKHKEIIALIKPLITELDKVQPNISESQAVQELERLAQKPLDWSGRDDISLKRDLQSLAEELKRRRRLKGGIEAYQNSASVYSVLNSLVQKCHAVGLFIVPVGELENWARHLTADITGSKPERALKAAVRIAACQRKEGDVWEFMKSVCKYLVE